MKILFGLFAAAGFAAPAVLAWQFTVLRRIQRLSLREFGWLLLGVVEILLLLVGIANILGHGEAAIAHLPMIVTIVCIPWVVALSIGITLVLRMAPKPPAPRPWSDRMGAIVLIGNLLVGCVSAPIFRVHEQLSDFSWVRIVHSPEGGQTQPEPSVARPTLRAAAAESCVEIGRVARHT